MSQTPYRVAPPGFMEEQWQTFEEEGIVVIEDALTNDEVRQYIEAIDRVATTLPECRDGAYCNPENIVEFDPVFTGLIDHPRHIGFAYDLYGELLKLHQSQFFLRLPGGNEYNSWHPDPPLPCPTAPSRPHCRCRSKSATGSPIYRARRWATWWFCPAVTGSSTWIPTTPTKARSESASCACKEAPLPSCIRTSGTG